MNLLKHLEGTGVVQLLQEPSQNGKTRHFSSRANAVFEQAIFDSQLNAYDKRDVATAYLDFLQETAASVTQVKAAKSKILSSAVMQNAPIAGAASGNGALMSNQT